MIRQDFILRQIELFGVFVRKLVTQRKAGDHESVRQAIESECVDRTGLDFDFLRTAQLDELVRAVTRIPGGETERLFATGCLLAEVAHLDYFRDDFETAKRQGLSALRILAFVGAQLGEPAGGYVAERFREIWEDFGPFLWTEEEIAEVDQLLSALPDSAS